MLNLDSFLLRKRTKLKSTITSTMVQRQQSGQQHQSNSSKHRQQIDSQTFLVPLYFALWYALNVAYNITNKWALQDVQDMVTLMYSSTKQEETNSQTRQHDNDDASHKPSALPITIGCIQFLVGSIYACTLWVMGCRRPVPHAEELRTLLNRTLSSIWKYCCRSLSSPPPTSTNNATTKTTTSTSTTTTTNMTKTNEPPLKNTFHIAIHHTLGQLCTVLSLSSNSISFTHVIKAMEPLFSALASYLFLGQRMDIRVYLSLIPVVGGVIMACAGSREFSWVAFLAGMGSNAFFAVRGVVSKLAMEGNGASGGGSNEDCTKGVIAAEFDNDENAKLHGNGKWPVYVEMDTFECEETTKDHPRRRTTGDAISPANLFSAVTCISFFLSIPLVVAFEGKILQKLLYFQYSIWMAKDGGGSNDLTTTEDNNTIDDKSKLSHSIMYIIASGLFHYLNNEVMYLVLSNVHPVTLAVGNTMKRVFIIVAGIVVFSTPTTLQTALGSTIGIGGVFVYSLMKQWYDGDSVSRKGGRLLGKELAIVDDKNDFVEKMHHFDAEDGGSDGTSVEITMLKKGLVHR